MGIERKKERKQAFKSKRKLLFFNSFIHFQQSVGKKA